MRELAIAVDIGGTFTDIVLALDDGAMHVLKVRSTPRSFHDAIVSGTKQALQDSDADPEDASTFRHSTTAATNTLIERSGPQTVLLTTLGFRDVLSIGRLRMPVLYDINYEKPEPLISAGYILEVDERMDARGLPIKVPDDIHIRELAESVQLLNPQSIAVCLLNAHRNDTHERLIADRLRYAMPNTPITLSGNLLPVQGEYERTSTTVVNAYLVPVVGAYLAALEEGLRSIGVPAAINVLQSDGNLIDADTASEEPVRIIESGPSAGVIAAQALATAEGMNDCISFDMGGTTAKACLIHNREVDKVSSFQVGGTMAGSNRLVRGDGQVVTAPFIDIAEVGAGGGSKIFIEPHGGFLRVGPESAGADPGPVAYDQGGDIPTVTDANIVLGYINPRYVAGGAVELNAVRCMEVFETSVAKPLGVSVEEAAWGVHSLANASMQKAILSVSSERGRNPEGYVLVASGGSGPLHAAHLAEMIGIRRVLVPPHPGLFSTFGLLVAPPGFEMRRPASGRLDEQGIRGVVEVVAELSDLVLKKLAAFRGEQETVQVVASVGVQYAGQEHVTACAFPLGWIDEVAESGSGEVLSRIVEELRREFLADYAATYGMSRGDDMHLSHIRVSGKVPGHTVVDWAGLGDLNTGTVKADHPPPATTRTCWFGESGWLEADVYSDRTEVPGGTQGPFVVEEYGSTLLVPPGWSADHTSTGSVLLGDKNIRRGRR